MRKAFKIIMAATMVIILLPIASFGNEISTLFDTVSQKMRVTAGIAQEASIIEIISNSDITIEQLEADNTLQAKFLLACRYKFGIKAKKEGNNLWNLAKENCIEAKYLESLDSRNGLSCIKIDEQFMYYFVKTDRLTEDFKKIEELADAGFVDAKYFVSKVNHLRRLFELKELCEKLDETLINQLETSPDVLKLRSEIKNRRDKIKSTFFPDFIEKTREMLRINNESVVIYEQEIREQEAKLKQLLTQYRPVAPEVQDLYKKINRLKDNLTELSEVRYLQDIGEGSLLGIDKENNIAVFRQSGGYHGYYHSDLTTTYPVSYFRKETYPTESLDKLWTNNIQRRDMGEIREVLTSHDNSIYAYSKVELRPFQTEGNVIIKRSDDDIFILDPYIYRLNDFKYSTSTALTFDATNRFLACRNIGDNRGCEVSIYDIIQGKVICRLKSSSVSPLLISLFTEDGKFLIVGNELFYVEDIISN